MKVCEAREVYPINAIGGLYVRIEGMQQEIYKGEADRLALETANQKGWKGNGRATIGIPTREGVHLYSRAYWFHERQ